jgi:cytochrome P450
MAIETTTNQDDGREVDLDYVREHFNPIDQRLVGEGTLQAEPFWNAVELMLEHCPVVHSDGRWFGCPEGGWVVNSYQDVVAVIQDPELFSNRVKKGAGEWEPAQIPIDIDPPILLDYRRYLQPYFTVKSVARFEPTARAITTALLDEFVETGRCDDIITQLAYPFSTQVQWTWLVGIDDVDHSQILDWILTIIHRRFEPVFDEARANWVAWIDRSIEQRRNEPRRDDLIDGLFHKPFQDRMLTDDEIARIMEIMIIGGVTATADAIGNILYRLAEFPDLQQAVRHDLTLLPNAIEEALRIDPPVTGFPRRCTRDTVLGGREIKEGEQLFVHTAAANRDAAEFEHPRDFDLDRPRNRHLTFGAGHHRCLGSNFARQNLRIVFEEILTRMADIRIVPEDPPRRTAGVGWMVSHLPLNFTPASRVGS